jgi:hypothetical protein
LPRSLMGTTSETMIIDSEFIPPPPIPDTALAQ